VVHPVLLFSGEVAAVAGWGSGASTERCRPGLEPVDRRPAGRALR
jgi:hypothetical protein